MLSEFQKQVTLTITESTTYLLEDEVIFPGPPKGLHLYIVPKYEPAHIEGFAGREEQLKMMINKFRENSAYECSVPTTQGQSETHLGWIRYVEPFEGEPTHETTLRLFPSNIAAEYQAALDAAVSKVNARELAEFHNLENPIPDNLLRSILVNQFPSPNLMSRARALSDR